MAYRLINRDNHWTGGLPSRGVYERIGRKNGGQGSERNEKLCKVWYRPFRYTARTSCAWHAHPRVNTKPALFVANRIDAGHAILSSPCSPPFFSLLYLFLCPFSLRISNLVILNIVFNNEIYPLFVSNFPPYAKIYSIIFVDVILNSFSNCLNYYKKRNKNTGNKKSLFFRLTRVRNNFER